MSPKKAKGLKLKEAKHLIANFQQSKTSRCAAVKPPVNNMILGAGT